MNSNKVVTRVLLTHGPRLTLLLPDTGARQCQPTLPGAAQETRDNAGNVIQTAYKEEATPFNYENGHITPNRAMDPDLVYNLTINTSTSTSSASSDTHAITATADEVLQPKLPENVEVSDDSLSELLVLAVDDSLVDRKVISPQISPRGGGHRQTVAGVDGRQEREENGKKEKSEKMKREK
ncbi:hypothetical protein L484_017950 [Morus notabilis]|uniref:Uncharacterized protein n=1 Tax=Morus notabilis TaxID=981085 RepID=W9RQD7_9ROSA|nr:hypothetical protein L484_017950 [Morus notabilis]